MITILKTSLPCRAAGSRGTLSKRFGSNSIRKCFALEPVESSSERLFKYCKHKAYDTNHPTVKKTLNNNKA